MGKIKVGAFLSLRGPGPEAWKRLCKKAVECESLGYNSIWIGDHFTVGNSRLVCLTALSALTAVTKNGRLGTLVLCNTFRPPSILAKMAATLDVFSGGRLEFGLGAGWNEREHVTYGLVYPKLGGEN